MDISKIWTVIVTRLPRLRCTTISDFMRKSSIRAVTLLLFFQIPFYFLLSFNFLTIAYHWFFSPQWLCQVVPFSVKSKLWGLGDPGSEPFNNSTVHIMVWFYLSTCRAYKWWNLSCIKKIAQILYWCLNFSLSGLYRSHYIYEVHHSIDKQLQWRRSWCTIKFIW